MIIVHVEHFLNPEGIKYFPQWIKETAETLKSYEGFVSIQQVQAIDSDNKCQLLLEFENLELLQKWSKSEDHEKLVNDKLSFYKIKKQKSIIYKSVKEKYTKGD